MFCSYSYEISLLKIVKKIIYLDQNVFSNAFLLYKKEKGNGFKAIIEKLDELAKKQLIICPYSDIHDLESHLMITDGKELFDLIQNMSRGKQFYLKAKIKEQQIIKAYWAFLNNEDLDKYELEITDAIDFSVHDWEPSIRVQSDFSLSQLILPDVIKKEKESFADEFIKALPHFHGTPGTILDYYKHEVASHAYLLLKKYLEANISENIERICNTKEVLLINILMEMDEKIKALLLSLSKFVCF